VNPPDAPSAVPECYRHPGRETYIRCQRCDRPICPDCMRDAAVGFQCPNCISEGAKQTRSGRTAYGGARSGNPALTSQILIGINALVWLLITTTGYRSSEWIDRLALLPRGLCEAPGGSMHSVSESVCASGSGEWFPGVSDGAFWQLMTSAFTHVEIWHLAVNMLALWFLGPQLELAIGRLRFIGLYLVSALGGSALVYVAAGEYSQTVGASGAVFGLMAALLVVAFKVRGNVQEILYWVGLNAVITLFFVGRISWQGHLGGFLTGLALTGVLVYAPRTRRTAWQAAGFAAIALVIVAAVVARTIALA
jgi:membrane associated rhomboid family serine protease